MSRTSKLRLGGIATAVVALVGVSVLIMASNLNSANTKKDKLTNQVTALQAQEARLAAEQSQLQQAQRIVGNAVLAHLVVYWATQTSADGTTTWVSAIDPPGQVSGVYQCPGGETFASVVPAA